MHTMHTMAQALRQLMFGSPDGSFNQEWRMQYFYFFDVPELEYGLVQIKV
jgi:hypothetical protein